MKEKLSILDLSKNHEKSKRTYIEKEEDQFEIHNLSTSSSLSSLNVNESFSTESKNPEFQFPQNTPSLTSLSIPKNFLLNLNKIKENPRCSYMNKLISKNLLISSQKKFNNIFIFDWDDTLLCTTVLNPYGYFDDEMEVQPSKMEKIEKLEIYVRSILSKALEKGDVYIITNSEAAWIEYSCERFFPSVYKFLNKIKIISARDLYEEKYPHDYKTWKIKAFNDIIKNYSLNLPTNIMSFGDSSYEIDASYDLKSKFPNGFVKVIKFKEYPLIQDLINQLNLVLEKFMIFYSTCKNLTINIEEEIKRNIIV